MATALKRERKALDKINSVPERKKLLGEYVLASLSKGPDPNPCTVGNEQQRSTEQFLKLEIQLLIHKNNYRFSD